MAVRHEQQVPGKVPVAPLVRPPGPRGMPFLGTAIQLQRDLLGTFHRALAEHGDVVRFVAGPPGLRTELYAFFHPDGVQHVLAGGAAHYCKGGGVYDELRAVLGNGLLTSEAEEWRRQKRLIQPLFKHQQVEAYMPMMASEGRALIDRWTQVVRGGGSTVGLNAEMTRHTLRVVGRALFGSAMEELVPIVGTAVPYLSKRALRRGLSPKPVPATWPTPGNRKADRTRERIVSVVDDLIARRRAVMRPAQGQPGGADGPASGADLLSLLLMAQDPEGGHGLDDEEVRAQVFLFLMAGHETTAGTLAFALQLLGHHPDVQARVRTEADEVLGDEPSIADLAALEYTTMAVKEAMRLYPVAHTIGRGVTAPDLVCSYHVPAAAAVAVSPWITHRHPRLWDDPERYDPERFSPEREAARHRYAWFPFGGGPRVCIGQHFAMLEVVLLAAQLVRVFDLVTKPGPVAVRTGITLRPEGSLPCRLVLR